MTCLLRTAKDVNLSQADTIQTLLPYADALDTSKTYYYFEPSASTDDKGGEIRTVTYNATTGKWVNPDGKNLVPQKEPYEYNSRTQFYTMKMVAPAKLNANDYKNAMPSILSTDNKINSVVQSAIDRYVARGTTHPELGLFMANYVLDNNPAKTVDANGAVVRESKQVVILFTDGQTNDLDKVDGEATYQTVFYRANRIKGLNKAELYTICLADSEDSKDATEMAKWLDQLSSNHPAVNGGNGSHGDAANIFDRSKAVSGGKYAKSIEDMSELSEIFTSITTDISTSTTSVQLDSSAVMQDYLTNGLKLPDDFGYHNIKISVVGMQATETNGEISYSEKTTANAVKDFVYNEQTGKYEYSSIALTVGFDKEAGMVSVTGFDYKKYYVAPKVSNGFKLRVQITGVEATEATPTDVLLDTNTKQSGIAYTVDGKAGLHPFEVPKTQLASKTYVMDYAKPMTISAADWGNVLGIADCSRLKVDETLTQIDTDFGTFAKNGDSYTFTPSTMQWGQPASFYVLRTLAEENMPEGVTTGANQWMRINVVPANNIYFEDDFADIDYTGNWSSDGTAAGSTENPEGAAGDVDGIHGWEGNLKDPQYSDGSAHKGVVNANTKAEASFTFTGTGVDIYGRTNGTTGTVLVTLRGGKLVDGYYEISKTLIVDTQSVSGDYYQIPAVTFMDLPYGTYTVTVRVTTAAADRFAYYLDGIRVYSPLAEDIGYAVAEQGAEVSQIRDLLASTGKNSAVFIDKAENGTVGAMKDYNATEYGIYGPKNEVYLGAGQSITFKVDIHQDAYYYIGLKCPTGSGNAVAKISNGDETTQQIGIDHAPMRKELALKDQRRLYILLDAAGEYECEPNQLSGYADLQKAIQKKYPDAVYLTREDRYDVVFRDGDGLLTVEIFVENYSAPDRYFAGEVWASFKTYQERITVWNTDEGSEEVEIEFLDGNVCSVRVRNDYDYDYKDTVTVITESYYNVQKDWHLGRYEHFADAWGYDYRMDSVLSTSVESRSKAPGAGSKAETFLSGDNAARMRDYLTYVEQLLPYADLWMSPNWNEDIEQLAS